MEKIYYKGGNLQRDHSRMSEGVAFYSDALPPAGRLAIAIASKDAWSQASKGPDSKHASSWI